MKVAIYILFTFGISIVFGQDEHFNRKKYINPTIVVDENNIPVDKETFYFPEQFFPEYKISHEKIDSTSFLASSLLIKSKDDSKVEDTFYLYLTPLKGTVNSIYLEWFSEQLFALKEPLLFNKETDKEVYRFTWLRTFDNPISLRIEKSKEGIRVYSKVGRGLGGYSPKKIKRSKVKKVTIDEWEEFTKLIQVMNFWNSINHGSIPASDGAVWILEGSTSDKYTVISKRFVSEGSPMYEVAMFLLHLSGTSVNKNRIY